MTMISGHSDHHVTHPHQCVNGLELAARQFVGSAYPNDVRNAGQQLQMFFELWIDLAYNADDGSLYSCRDVPLKAKLVETLDDALDLILGRAQLHHNYHCLAPVARN
jgi:hypothetical protein